MLQEVFWRKTFLKPRNSSPLQDHSSQNGCKKPHFELLMRVGECMVQEQCLEFLNMESFDSQTTHSMTKDVDDPENQRDN